MKANVIAARREKVAELALGHRSENAIAAALGVPRGTVHHDIVALRREWQEHRLRDTEQIISEDLQRLELIEKAILGAALAGDYHAIDRLLKVQERRARLLGLDAAIRVKDETVTAEEMERLLLQAARRIAEEQGLNVNEVLEMAQSLLNSL